MGVPSNRMRSILSSIVCSIYDLAVMLTLLIPLGVVLAVGNRRFLFAFVLSVCLLSVVILAFAVGRGCDFTVKDYFKSIEQPRDHERS